MSSVHATEELGAVETPEPRTRAARVVVAASRRCAYLMLIALAVVMVAEVISRYLIGAPLGWNISLIEKVLLPGIVFLGLPWACASGAHVSAGMVYERLPAGAQRICRAVAGGLELFCYLALLIAGVAIAWTMYDVGAVPPPLSAQLPIPTWIWRTFLPLGAAGAALVLIDLWWVRAKGVRA